MARKVRITADDIRFNFDRIRDRIASAGRDPDDITIVAVAKGHEVDVVEQAVAAGATDIGENYAQELAAKAEAITGPASPRWHFIGQLQRNKVRQIAHLVHLWQSVDRLSVGREIAARAAGASVLVQVNLTDDPARGGAKPSFVPAVVAGLRDLELDVQGLMAVAPLAGPAAARAGFDVVRGLADELDLPVRSIGMTADLEVAVECGSTMVRIGTALFGPRF